MRIAIILVLSFLGGAISSSVLDNDIIPSLNYDGDATRMTAGARRWPEGRVPYVMQDTVPSETQAIVQWAMEYLMRDSNIVFVPRTTQENYIVFNIDAGCSSALGMQQGPQGLSMGKGCESVGFAAHEIMHALGFPHESERRERDYYVITEEENTKESSIQLSMYNVLSIMHTSGSHMTPRNDDLKDIYPYGRQLLTHCDWASLNKLYPGKKLPPPCTNENVDDTPYETFPTEHGRNVLGSKADFLCRYDACFLMGEGDGEARCQFVDGGFKEWKFPRSIFDPCYGKGPKCEGDRPMWADPSITRPRKKFRPYIPEQGPVACFDMDRNSGGYDIRTITSPNAEACQIECTKNDECRYFTYDVPKSLCWLKRNQSKLGIELGLISGPRRCSCAERRVEYLGDVIRVLKAVDTTACQEECKGRTDCRFYKFDTQFQQCAIMTSAYGTMESPTVDSGPKECDGAKPPRGDDVQPCFERDTAYYGADIGDMPAESALECQRRCDERPDCLYFTFDPNTSGGHCYLKDKKISSKGMVSGPRKCAASCIEVGSNYAGNDLPGSPHKKDSVTQCQKLCQADSSCKFFTYHQIGECFLKDAKDVIRFENDRTSGPKFCPAEECWDVGVNYKFNDLPGTPTDVASVGECQMLCKAEPRCLYFTFHNGSCWLKTKKDNITYEPSRISGPKDC